MLDDLVDLDSFSDSFIVAVMRFQEVANAEHTRQRAEAEAELSAQRTARRSKVAISGKDRERQDVSRQVAP